MKTILALILSGVAFGQSLNLSVSPASVTPGATVTLTLTFADTTPTSSIAGLQWTLSTPASVTVGTVASGASTTTGNKVITCGTVGCIDVGSGATLNMTALTSGVIATYPLTVSSTAAPGQQAFNLTGLFAINSAGSAVVLTTTGVNLAIMSKYDLNGDGTVNGADVNLAIQQLVTGNCSAPFSGVGDGKCGIADVALEILAALGSIH